MRPEGSSRGDTRSSALWGKRSTGESRSSALWGKGGRGFAALVAALALMVAGAPGAGADSSNSGKTYQVIVQGDGSKSSYDVAEAVLDAIVANSKERAEAAEREAHRANEVARAAEEAAKRSNARALELDRAVAAAQAKAAAAQAKADAASALAPTSRRVAARAAKYQRIAAALAEAAARAQATAAEARTVAAEANESAAEAREEAAGAQERAAATAARLKEDRARARDKQIYQQFSSISGIAAELTLKQITEIGGMPGILALTPDAPVVLTGLESYNPQVWPVATGVVKSWKDGNTANMPAIAIIDSGIDKNHGAFGDGSRVIDEQVITKLTPNSGGDGRGHGTFVASIAAGSAPGHFGAEPDAKIVSLDVMDDKGMALTSDVIAAADWILKNKESKNIRVANFSLHTSLPTSFMFDPLDRAVEKLWFSGVVVVASSGNFALNGQASGVPFAPGNDPFVITVGAIDTGRKVPVGDDFNAPWSAFGYTLDGFAKPELGAPGRYMVGAVPMSSTLAAERPDKIVAPGYMQMSGTSFAAPIVAGAAASIIAAHPNWTPDQVKGALMLAAKPTPLAAPYSTGVGEVNVAKAAGVSDPPNPNLALYKFVIPDPAGGAVPVFDAAAWARTALADASWANASWANASWANASWSNASWANASWANASWATASWANVALADASWANASWANASWANASWANASWSNASWANASWANVSTSQSDASWANGAEDDAIAAGGYVADPTDVQLAELEAGIDLDSDGLVGPPPPAATTDTTAVTTTVDSTTTTASP